MTAAAVAEAEPAPPPPLSDEELRERLAKVLADFDTAGQAWSELTRTVPDLAARLDAEHVAAVPETFFDLRYRFTALLQLDQEPRPPAVPKCNCGWTLPAFVSQLDSTTVLRCPLCSRLWQSGKGSPWASPYAAGASVEPPTPVVAEPVRGFWAQLWRFLRGD